MKKSILTVAGVILAASLTYSAPVQLSVANYNLPDDDVSGVRINLFYGETDNVSGLNLNPIGLSKVENFKGLDLGFISVGQTTGDFTGVSLNLINYQQGNTSGLNISGANIVKNMRGLNIGLVNYATPITYVDEMEGYVEAAEISDGTYTEVGVEAVKMDTVKEDREDKDFMVNLGLLNIGERDVKVNLGAFNYTEGHTAFDLGLANYADSTTFQLGLVNATRNLEGIQVGIINYAENGAFPVLPIVNFRVSVE